MRIYFKEFGVPLLPFFFHLLLNLIFSEATSWWQYVDARILLLTFSFWALYFTTRTPTSSAIPSDSAVEDDMRVVKDSFTYVVVIGFAFYGIITFCQALGYMGDDVFNKLGWCTVVFCLYTVVVIFWHRSAIKRVVEA